MKRLATALAALALTLVASGASAQQPAGGAQTAPGVLKLGVIEIVGRVQKPIASIDVGKIPPKLTLAELRQPFLDKIEEAIQHDPF
jgi:hypothetical protein